MEIKSDKEQNLSENCSDSHRWCSEAFFKKKFGKIYFYMKKEALSTHSSVLQPFGNVREWPTDPMHIQPRFTCSVMSSMAQYSISWGIPPDKRGNSQRSM